MRKTSEHLEALINTYSSAREHGVKIESALRQFCKAKGLSPSTAYRWLRDYKRQNESK